jgi:hypothetical protein
VVVLCLWLPVRDKLADALFKGESSDSVGQQLLERKWFCCVCGCQLVTSWLMCC